MKVEDTVSLNLPESINPYQIFIHPKICLINASLNFLYQKKINDIKDKETFLSYHEPKIELMSFEKEAADSVIPINFLSFKELLNEELFCYLMNEKKEFDLYKFFIGDEENKDNYWFFLNNDRSGETPIRKLKNLSHADFQIKYDQYSFVFRKKSSEQYEIVGFLTIKRPPYSLDYSLIFQPLTSYQKKLLGKYLSTVCEKSTTFEDNSKI